MPEVVKVKSEEPLRGPGAPLSVPEPARKLAEYPRRFRQFLHEVRVELRHVNWPTWNDVKSTTAVVIITVFVFAVFLSVVDYSVTRVVQRVLNLKP